mmetsp:Transcript_114739/g.225113  ORF Transcript_114739/g.225113 Transcript_114739/m.225113 type:complete len:248 (+) Transcript_114739:110-853(+)
MLGQTHTLKNARRLHERTGRRLLASAMRFHAAMVAARSLAIRIPNAPDRPITPPRRDEPFQGEYRKLLEKSTPQSWRVRRAARPMAACAGHKCQRSDSELISWTSCATHARPPLRQTGCSARKRPHAAKGMYTPSVAYILSMISACAASTAFRLILFVGVSSPPCWLKFVGKMVNFWILKALFLHTRPFEFATLIAAVTASIQAWSRMAALIVSTWGFTFLAGASSWSDPGTSPFAPTAFKVTRAVQ